MDMNVVPQEQLFSRTGQRPREWQKIQCFLVLPQLGEPGDVVHRDTKLWIQNPWDATLACEMEVGAALDPKGVRLINAAPVTATLGPGESGVVTIPALVPPTAKPGNYDIGFYVRTKVVSRGSGLRIYPEPSRLGGDLKTIAANVVGVGLMSVTGGGFLAFPRGEDSQIWARLLIVGNDGSLKLPARDRLMPTFEPLWIDPRLHHERLTTDPKWVAKMDEALEGHRPK
jgi:hypothetical protein